MKSQLPVLVFYGFKLIVILFFFLFHYHCYVVRFNITEISANYYAILLHQLNDFFPIIIAGCELACIYVE